MRLGDAVKLIKGPKGTQVFLTVKRVDGLIEEVVITRDIVEIEESYAKSSLINKNEKLYGLIELPKFYIDFNKKNFRKIDHGTEEFHSKFADLLYDHMKPFYD